MRGFYANATLMLRLHSFELTICSSNNPGILKARTWLAPQHAGHAGGPCTYFHLQTHYRATSLSLLPKHHAYPSPRLHCHRLSGQRRTNLCAHPPIIRIKGKKETENHKIFVTLFFFPTSLRLVLIPLSRAQNVMLGRGQQLIRVECSGCAMHACKPFPNNFRSGQ